MYKCIDKCAAAGQFGALTVFSSQMALHLSCVNSEIDRRWNKLQVANAKVLFLAGIFLFCKNI